MSDKPTPDSTLSPSFLLSACIPLLQREARRVMSNRKRALKRGNAATLTFSQWLRLLQHYEWRCAFCSSPFESIEHIVPLREGGGTTAANCVPACLNCNRSRDKMQQLEQNVLKEVAQIAQI